MKNTLYPIFLKTDQLLILVVGGGAVALEKLQFLYKSSPNSRVLLVAPRIDTETRSFIQDKEISYIADTYKESYLNQIGIVIAATNLPLVNEAVYADCKKRNLLINVADNPPLCDFYMGSIVTKGNLKIGISTNGKSPTVAKRLRQWLEAVLPEEIDDLLDYLEKYRSTLKGNFEAKVKALNKATETLIR